MNKNRFLIKLNNISIFVYLSFIAITISCSSIKPIPEISSKPILQLDFKKQNTLSEGGRIRFDSMQQVMIDEIIKEKPEAAINITAFPPGFMASMFAETNPEKLSIFLGDTLWSTLYSGDVHHYRYDTLGQKCYVHYNRNEAPINISNYTRFDTSRLSAYQEYPNDRMMISGFNCFKVEFSIKENSDSLFELGDDMFEMYVTDQIDLPMAMVFPFQLPDKSFFPLRITRWSACCKGGDEITILDKVLYKE